MLMAPEFAIGFANFPVHKPVDRIVDQLLGESMHDPMQTEWNVDERMPKYDDIRSFDVFVFGYKRSVRRVGNRSRFFTPGTLIFTDCTHPLQNVLCDEQQVTAWRHHQGQV